MCEDIGHSGEEWGDWLFCEEIACFGEGWGDLPFWWRMIWVFKSLPTSDHQGYHILVLQLHINIYLYWMRAQQSTYPGRACIDVFGNWLFEILVGMRTDANTGLCMDAFFRDDSVHTGMYNSPPLQRKNPYKYQRQQSSSTSKWTTIILPQSYQLGPNSNSRSRSTYVSLRSIVSNVSLQNKQMLPFYCDWDWDQKCRFDWRTNILIHFYW